MFSIIIRRNDSISTGVTLVVEKNPNHPCQKSITHKEKPLKIQVEDTLHFIKRVKYIRSHETCPYKSH
jgi:hypothetical protein